MVTSVPLHWRQRAALVELVVLVGPPALLWTLTFVPVTVGGIFPGNARMPRAFWLPIEAYLVLEGAFAIGCVVIVLAFVEGGRSGLERTRRVRWILATTGMLLSGFATLNILLRLPLPTAVRNLPPQDTAWLLYSWLGAPAIIPMLHMYVERWQQRRARTNFAADGGQRSLSGR